ncbi:MAG: TonB family protein [Betaproteobacteria bacterium]
MMTTTRLLSVSWRTEAGRRLGAAILASALLHALLLFSLSVYPVHGRVFTGPVRPALSVRIEKLPLPQEATQVAIDKKKAVHHLMRQSTAPLPATVPANIEPPLSQPGVSVTTNRYLKPVGGRAASALLDSGEFRRASEISEMPEIVSIRVPEYPRPAREQTLSGWVIVMLLVDEQGKVVEAAPVESSEAFSDYDKRVAEELRGSTFNPGKLDGRAVKAMMFVTVRFDPAGLPDPAKATDTTATVPAGTGNKH